MFCRECGTKLEDNATVCSECGAVVQPISNSSIDETVGEGNSFKLNLDGAPEPEPIFRGQMYANNSEGSVNTSQQENTTTAYNPNSMYSASNDDIYPDKSFIIRPMKWFKFITIFVMPLTILIYIIIAGICFFTNATLFDFNISIPLLKGIGVACIVLVVIVWKIRSDMVKYKKAAPIEYLIYLIVGELSTPILQIVSEGKETFKAETSTSSVIMGIIFIALNILYFYKRRDMFRN